VLAKRSIEEQKTVAAQARSVWFIWFVLLIWLIWFIRLVSFNQTNKTNQINHGTVFFRWRLVQSPAKI
jgi:uncharacterized integral membrane protein